MQGDAVGILKLKPE